LENRAGLNTHTDTTRKTTVKFRVFFDLLHFSEAVVQTITPENSWKLLKSGAERHRRNFWLDLAGPLEIRNEE
jgi:hypothetical protein